MASQKFELKTQLLKEGRSTEELPGTDRTRLSLKYLVEGGEVMLHSHTYEDQAYLVLDGEATFYDQDDQPTVVRRGEGMIMPAGTLYRFERSGAGPAVVLRVGGTTADSWDHYLKGDGSPLVIDYGSVTGTPADGSFWTLDGVVEEQRVS